MRHLYGPPLPGSMIVSRLHWRSNLIGLQISFPNIHFPTPYSNLIAKTLNFQYPDSNPHSHAQLLKQSAFPEEADTLILRDYNACGRGGTGHWQSDGGTDGCTRGLYLNPTTNAWTQQLKINAGFNENRNISMGNN